MLRSAAPRPATRPAGLRRSVVMAGSSVAAPECDAEGGQGSAWVAGVAAQRGGDVDRPRPAQHPMTRLRRQAMTLGPAAVRSWEVSSQKVTSRMWRSASIAPCPRSRSASRAGLACSNGRPVTAYTVTVCQRRVMRAGRGSCGWPGGPGRRGEPEMVHVDGLEGAELDAAVGLVTGAVGHEHAVPGQALEAGQQMGRLALTTSRSWACLRATRNSAASGWVCSASAVTIVPAGSSPSSSGWNAHTSSGARPT
jgi:hypothetical protein